VMQSRPRLAANAMSDAAHEELRTRFRVRKDVLGYPTGANLRARVGRRNWRDEWRQVASHGYFDEQPYRLREVLGDVCDGAPNVRRRTTQFHLSGVDQHRARMRRVEGANARAIDGGVIAEKYAEPPALTLGADFVLGRRKLVVAREWEHESAEPPRLSRATVVGIAGDRVA